MMMWAISSYTYDDIYQLIQTTDHRLETTDYNYDEVGNRLSVVNSGTTTYVPDEMNQYDEVGGIPYTYDANGNLTSDGTNAYTYDYENRLTSVDYGLSTVDYSYDAFGRRIQKVTTSPSHQVTNYIYDGDQIIMEIDSSGTTQAKYIFGPGIDEPILMERGGEAHYYHFDGLGSVTDLTDSSGTVIESYSYDVYGNPSATSTIGNPYMFTGREYDTETGLYYYRARYYDPGIGRFLQRDIKTWQPNDSRILEKNEDISEFFEAVFIIYPNLKYNTRTLSKGKRIIVQTYRPDTRINYYTEELVDEELVRIFTQLQGQSYPKFLHLYSYCLNNPVNYIDPSGEVADWMVYLMIAAWIAGQIRYAVWAMKGPVGKPAPEQPGPAVPPVQVPPPVQAPVGF